MARSPAQALGWSASWLRTLAGRLWRLEAEWRGAKFEGPSRIEGRPIISVAHGSAMRFGANIALNSFVRANPLACFQPCTIRTLATGAELIVGANVGMSGAVICAGKHISIGDGTIFGSGAMVLDNDFHVLDAQGSWKDEHVANARPVRIGCQVFVGARAIILKGVTIGDRAMIGAGAVVTRDVPADHMAAGNPAQARPKRH
jgi:acetyltransferase-like isoleucine patch superfamily enzyme